MIFARSPYIVTIDEVGQESTRLELFIWNGTGAAPLFPSYSLSKQVSGIDNIETYYNLSPFIREYFDFTKSNPYLSTSNANTNQYAYCNVKYKTYFTIDGVESLIDENTDKAYDGYGLYENGSNYVGQKYLLSDKSLVGGSNTYYYPCEINNTLQDPGSLTIQTATDWSVRYTNLETGAVQGFNLGNDITINVRKVWSAWLSVGNKLEVLNSNDVVQIAYYFVPQCECKYDVITCDFINRWGGWQREFFYKASNESVEMSNTQYKLNPTDFPNYNLYEGQIKTFNTNAKRSIKVNTGWVEENYKVTLEEMLMSEVIRINGLPAILKTKSVEKFKSINTKTINYQMEFEMAYDIINTIS